MTTMRFLPVILAATLAACQQSGSTPFSDVTSPLAPSGVSLEGEEAATIRIIAGQLLVERPDYRGTLDLKGTAAFRLSSNVSMSGGLFGPFVQCTGTMLCIPGTAVSLRATWVDSDLPSYVTLRGTEYRTGLAPRDAVASVAFDGLLTLPPFGEDPTAEVSAPFTFSGAFKYFPDASNTGATEILKGHGIARLTFQQRHEAGTTFWTFTHAVYEFNPTNRPASVP